MNRREDPWTKLLRSDKKKMWRANSSSIHVKTATDWHWNDVHNLSKHNVAVYLSVCVRVYLVYGYLVCKLFKAENKQTVENVWHQRSTMPWYYVMLARCLWNPMKYSKRIKRRKKLFDLKTAKQMYTILQIILKLNISLFSNILFIIVCHFVNVGLLLAAFFPLVLFEMLWIC